MTTNATAPRRVGRPRDPRVERALRDAAARLYADEGWVGFNFEAVARAAGVGKGAVYLRWPSREQLIIDAIRVIDVDAIVAGETSLRGKCRRFAEYELQWWGDDTGRAYLRLQIDQIRYPFLGELYRKLVLTPFLTAFRAAVGDALTSGEIPIGISATMLAEALSGGIMTHMSGLSSKQRAALARSPDAYLDRLVELALAGSVAAATVGQEMAASPTNTRRRPVT